MAAMVSSVRRPRVRGSAPVAGSSSSIHPTPTHIRTRPPESTSTVAIRLARTTGLVVGEDEHPGGERDPVGDGRPGRPSGRAGRGSGSRRAGASGPTRRRGRCWCSPRRPRRAPPGPPTRSRTPRRGGRTRSSSPGSAVTPARTGGMIPNCMTARFRRRGRTAEPGFADAERKRGRSELPAWRRRRRTMVREPSSPTLPMTPAQ